MGLLEADVTVPDYTTVYNVSFQDHLRQSLARAYCASADHRGMH